MNNYDGSIGNCDVQCERKDYTDLRLSNLSKSFVTLYLNGYISLNSGGMLLIVSVVHFLSITKTWE